MDQAASRGKPYGDAVIESIASYYAAQPAK